MGRPATVQLAIVNRLAQDARRFTPSALSVDLGVSQASIWAALNPLLSIGSVKAAKYNKTGFVYRHPLTPEDAPLVEVKMVRCFVIDGKPIKFLGE